MVLTPGLMVREPMTQSPNPLLLPAATALQAPDTTAYNNLDVETLAVGSTYADPISGATIYRLTDANFPNANASCGHDYAEGNQEVSLPWSGTKRTFLMYRLGGGPFTHWLIDFDPNGDPKLSNARELTDSLDPDRDICATFSNNPATPYYIYICNGGTVRRFDVRDGSEVTGGGWPWAGSIDAWLQQSKDDARFVGWRSGTTTMVMYEPGTATQKTYQNANGNEPRLETDGRYVGLSMNTPNNGGVFWDWNDNAVDWTHDGDGSASEIPFAHNANLRSLFAGVNWNLANPKQFWTIDPADSGSPTNLSGGANADPVHCSGNWIQSVSQLDQWFIAGIYNGTLDPGASYLGRGAIVFRRPSGGIRYLAHAYNTSAVYERFPFAKLSPDGRYVLFTSNMNGQSRCDLFLAVVPTS